MTTNAGGNYGTVEIDSQSDSIKIAGLICKNFSFDHTHPAGKKPLRLFCRSKQVAISDVDTRAPVRIRENGAQMQ